MTLLRELQRDALNPDVDIVTVLRKARVLAARLHNAEFVAWVQHELDGYPAAVDLPKYRILNVDSRAHLIMGLMHMPRAPVMASQVPEQFRQWATTSYLASSVSELSSLIAGVDNTKHEGLQCPWPQELAVEFGAAGYGDGRSRVQCIGAWQEISVSAVVGVVETVRNRLLEFVLQIEAEAPGAGEVAPGETPLPQEQVTQFVNNYIFGGVTHIIAERESSHVSNRVQIGSMSSSQIQQGGAHSLQTTLSFSRGSQERSDLERLVREVSEHLDELKLGAQARRKAEVQVRTIQAQLADDEPEPGIVAQAGATLRNVTEGAIGSLIASAAQPTVWHWVGHAIAVLFPS
jgi:hypothetical protein